MNITRHTPVLLKEIVEFLAPAPGKVIIDCTLGLGGHASELANALQDKGALYGIDMDERNLVQAKENLKNHSHVHFTHDTFQNLEEIGQRILAKEGGIHGILFDLGLSSPHVDDPERGFSFQKDGPLDMRFDSRQELTAADIVNTYSLQDLTSIFQTYGEEKFSYRIAREIVEFRKHQHFTTTTQLADFIAKLFIPKSILRIRPDPKDFYFKGLHPATRIFQALRIATNREVEALAAGLEGAVKVISPHGRIAVISYHSIEDRMVKNFFREKAKEGELKILTKKPVTPGEQEIAENPRSRSAKLRVAEKLS